MIKKHKRVRSGWMRRTSRVYLSHLNVGKIEQIKTFLNTYVNAVNYCITRFWSTKDLTNKLPDFDVTNDVRNRFNLTARLAQCVAKQAKEITHSQHKLSISKRSMPRLINRTANLDSRFVTIESFDGSFDMCIKLASGVPKIVIPFNWTKHTNKFRNNNWELSKSIRIGYDDKGLFVDLIFEKEKPKLRETGKVIGIDQGYRTMLVTSDDQYVGNTIKNKIKNGGKRKKTQHHYITTEQNRALKELKLGDVKTIILEDLKYVKANKRGKFSRQSNRLLSFWHYAKVIERLMQRCEELGIRIEKKSPWKTSQRCSVCGNIDRRNRNSEKFQCRKCQFTTNADYNASRNLEQLGLAEVYSLRLLERDVE